MQLAFSIYSVTYSFLAPEPSVGFGLGRVFLRPRRIIFLGHAQRQELRVENASIPSEAYLMFNSIIIFLFLLLEVQCSHYSCTGLVDFNRKPGHALLGRELEKVSRDVRDFSFESWNKNFGVKKQIALIHSFSKKPLF